MAATSKGPNAHAIENATAHMKSILKLYQKHLALQRNALKVDTVEDYEALEQECFEMPLEMRMRDDWYPAGTEPQDRVPSEVELLLSTGGPACRVWGDLDRGVVKNAEIQWQDWGTPWTRLVGGGVVGEALDWFANQFYWAEG